MKAYTLSTVIQGHEGSGMGFRHQIKHFDDEDVAKQAMREHVASIRALVEQAKIVMPTDRGPQVVTSLSEFLGRIGIGNVGHSLTSGEVHGAVVLAPTPSIVLAKN